MILYCEDDELDNIKDSRVEIRNISTIPKFLEDDNPNVTCRFGPFALIRCYLPKLLPDEEKCIWLDADTLVNQPLKELETLDMTRKAVAMVFENNQPPKHFPDVPHLYCNSGVCLMNLDFIRRYKIDDKWLHLLQEVKFPYPDQDAINIACSGVIEYLPITYNYAPSTLTKRP